MTPIEILIAQLAETPEELALAHVEIEKANQDDILEEEVQV